jgi:hypothetical protein
MSARRCAFLAMLQLVALALLSTGIAHRSTHFASRTGQFAGARQEACGRATRLRTVGIETDAASHRLHVLFLQAGRSAVIASLRALIASIYARFKLLMWHIYLLVETRPRCAVSTDGSTQ